MNSEVLLNEVVFKAVPSQGAGGQHVNKVSTKVLLIFDLKNSRALTEEEKARLRDKIKNRLTKEDLLIVQASDTRSQKKNRVIATEKLLELVRDGLKTKTVRKKTKPTKASKEKRLKSKKKTAEKKISRQKPQPE